MKTRRFFALLLSLLLLTQGLPTTVFTALAEVSNTFSVKVALPTYTVSFYDSDGTTLLKSQTVKQGEAATAPTQPQHDGYQFDSWSPGFTNVTSNLTVTAVYKKLYTVTFFDADGSKIESQPVASGAGATPPTVSIPTGYSSVSWTPTTYTSVTSDMAVTAVYTSSGTQKALFAVMVDGAWVQRESRNITGSGNFYLSPATAFSFGGKNFSLGDSNNNVRWSTSSFANATSNSRYFDSSNGRVRGSGYSSNTTIYARPYNSNAATYSFYTVVFKDYNGTVLKAQTVASGFDARTIKPSDPSRGGDYTFTGWDKNDTQLSSITSPTVVTALYSKAKFTVNFYAKDGTTLLGNFPGISAGGSIPVGTWPSAPQHIDPNFEFIGWSVDSLDNITRDINVYARYVERFTVKFYERDKVTQIDTDQTVDYGAAANAPNAPDLTASKLWFVGWGTEDGTVTEDYLSVDKDLVLFAQYVPMYTVNFYGRTEDANNVLLKTQDVAPGTGATAPDIGDVTGFVFTGWNKDFKAVTGDLEVNAQYRSATAKHIQFVRNDKTVVDVYGEAGEEIVVPGPRTVPESDGIRYYGFNANKASKTGYVPGSTYKITDNATLYEIFGYVITFSPGKPGYFTAGTAQPRYTDGLGYLELPDRSEFPDFAYSTGSGSSRVVYEFRAWSIYSPLPNDEDDRGTHPFGDVMNFTGPSILYAAWTKPTTTLTHVDVRFNGEYYAVRYLNGVPVSEPTLVQLVVDSGSRSNVQIKLNNGAWTEAESINGGFEFRWTSGSYQITYTPGGTPQFSKKVSFKVNKYRINGVLYTDPIYIGPMSDADMLSAAAECPQANNTSPGLDFILRPKNIIQNFTYSIKFLDHFGTLAEESNIIGGTAPQISVPAKGREFYAMDGDVLKKYTFLNWTPAPANPQYTLDNVINKDPVTQNMVFNAAYLGGDRDVRLLTVTKSWIGVPVGVTPPNVTYEVFRGLPNSQGGVDWDQAPIKTDTLTAPWSTTFEVNKNTLVGDVLTDYIYRVEEVVPTGYTRTNASSIVDNNTYTLVNQAIDYKVTYVLNGAPSGVSEPAELTGKHVGDSITVAAIPPAAGYTLAGWLYTDDSDATADPVKWDPSTTQTMPAANVTLTATYAVRTDYEYRVEYRKDSATGDELAPAKPVTGKTFGATYTEAAAAVTGYTPDALTKDITLDLNNKVLVFIYTVRTDYEYTVEYRKDSVTGDELAPAKPVTGKTFGATYTEAAAAVTGYTPDALTKDITLDLNNKVLVFIYTVRTDYEYTVEYRKDSVTGDELAPAKPVTGKTFGATYTEAAAAVTGYTPDALTKDITLDLNNKVLVFIYTVRTDYEYTVEYRKDSVTGDELAPAKPVTGKTFGATYTEAAAAVTGYTPDALTKDITLDLNNKVLVFIYTVRTDYEYTVEYRKDSVTGDELAPAKPVTGKTFGATYTEAAAAVTGYTPDALTKDITLDLNNKVLVFIYTVRTDYEYTVEYRKDSVTGDELAPAKPVTGKTFGATYTEAAAAVTGYTPDALTKDITLDLNNKVLVFIYTVRTDYEYTVEYRKDSVTGDELAPAKPVTGKTFGATYTEAAAAVTGYTPDALTKDITLDLNNKVLVFIYTVRTDYEYTVEYRKDSVTGDELAPAKPVTGKTFGATYTEAAAAVTGYTPDALTKDITLDLNNKVLVFIYTVRTDYEYTVEYRKDSVTGDELAPAKPVTGKTFGATYTEAAAAVTGYTPDALTKDITLDLNNKVLVFIYTVRTDYEYRVEYRKDSATGDELAPAKPVTGKTFGATYTEAAAAVTGYTPDALTKDITLDLNNKVLVFIYTAVEYEVKYILGSQQYEGIDNQHYGDQVEVRPDPTEIGSTFGGWNLMGLDPWIGTDGKTYFTMPARNVEIVGSFTKNIYPVKYFVDGAQYVDENDFDGYNYNTPVDVRNNPTARPGYTFSGWHYLDNTPVVEGFLMPTAEVRIYGIFTPIEYTLTYKYVDSSGVEITNPAILSSLVPAHNSTEKFTVLSNSNVDAVPTINGFTISGWYQTKYGSYLSNKLTGNTWNTPGDKTLYAKVQTNCYELKYRYVDGSGTEIAANSTIVSGLNPGQNSTESFTVLSNGNVNNVPTKNGYTITGWYATRNQDGSLADQLSGNTWNTPGDKILYAKILTIEYTLTYKYVDGSGAEITNLAILSGLSPAQNGTEKFTVLSNSNVDAVPTINGFTITGWYKTKNADGSLADKLSGNTWNTPGDKTLYAKVLTNEYTLTYKYVDSSGVEITNPAILSSLVPAHNSTEKFTVLSNSNVDAVPTINGFTISGWYQTKYGSYLSNKLTGNTWNTPGDKTLYAKVQTNCYELKYRYVDGSGTEIAANSTIVSGLNPGQNSTESFTVLSNGNVNNVPTKNGYTITGWYATRNQDGSLADQLSGNTWNTPGDKILYAKILTIEYTLTYKYVDGSGAEITNLAILSGLSPAQNGTEKFTVLSNSNVDAVPTKNGFTISGWYQTKTGGSLSNKLTGNTWNTPGDKTLYAKIEANEYELDYAFVDADGNALSPIPAGLTLPTSTTYTVVDPAVVKPVPTLTGWTITGWNTSKYMNGGTYIGGSSFSAIGGGTLYAKVTINKHTVTYVIDDTVYDTEPNVAYGTPKTVLGAPAAGSVPTGYTFAGWAAPIGLTVTDNNYTMPDNDVTFVANLTRNIYTVTYLVDGTQDGELEGYFYDNDVTVRPEPTKTGFTFSGWVYTSGMTGTVANFKMPTSNVVIEGTFTPITYTLKYKYVYSNGTEIPANLLPGDLSPAQNGTETYTVVAPATVDALPTLADWLEYGWYKNSLSGPQVIPGSEFAETPNGLETTLYAKLIKVNASLDVDKYVMSFTPFGGYKLGDTISYKVVVENNGNVPLTDVILTDALLTPAPAAVTLEPGQKMEYTYTHVVTDDDIQSSFLKNVATATGKYGDKTAQDDDDKTVFLKKADPKLEVSKTVLTNEPFGGFNWGDVIKYRVTVKNTGNVAIANIALTDAFLNGGTPVVIGTLNAGQSSTAYEYTYTVTEADILSINHKVENTATASGIYRDRTIGDSDKEDVNVKWPCPSIDLDKTVKSTPANGDYYKLGEEIKYEVTVKNTGNVTLTDVLVKDAKLSPTPTKFTLGPTETKTFTYSYFVAESDLPFEHVYNKAEVWAKFKIWEKYDFDLESVKTDKPRPGITLEKVVTNPQDGVGGFALGETIWYKVTVTNTGNVTLKDVLTKDDKMSPDGTAVSLAPGATLEYTYSYVVKESDIEQSYVRNEATTKGKYGYHWYDDDKTLKTATEPLRRSLNVKKEVTNPNAGGFALGDTIKYKVTVTNDGNVTVTDIELSDDLLPGSPVTIGTLAPGASADPVEYEYTVTYVDIDRGNVPNTATAIGNHKGTPVSDSDSLTTDTEDPKPSLDVTKVVTTPKTGGFALGDTIEYKLTVKNTGNVELKNITVDDSRMVPNPATIDSLKPGDTEEFTYTYGPVVEADILRTFVYNKATASTTYRDSLVKDWAELKTKTEKINPKLDVTKKVTSTPASQAGYALGESVTYELTVKNIGNVTLKNITVADGMMNPSSTVIPQLAPNASQVFTYSHKVTEANILAGFVYNAAAGWAWYGIKLISDGDDKTVDTEPANPSLKVEKTITSQMPNGGYRLGDTINYSVRVTNDGNQTVRFIKVNDALMPAQPNISSLAPGEYKDYTYSHVVTEADILSGKVPNTFTAKGKYLLIHDVTAEASADATTEPVNRTMTVEKSASQPTDPKGFLLGQDISYIVTVTNTGNQTLTDIKVNDPMMGPDDLNIGSLVPGATSQAITYTHKVTEMDILNGNGQLKNVATATTEGLEESADATVKIELVNRTMTVEKSASQPTDPKGFLLGQDISYIVTVTNTGNQTLTDIKVNDPMMGPDDLNIGSLVPGATSQAITYTHKVTEMDILNGNGQLKNVATATTEGLEESADATVKIELVNRTMTVEKSASQPTDPKGFLLGQDISYIVTVTNTGNQTLTDIKVNDPMMGPDDLNIGSLVPGATSQAITYTHEVTEMDILNGNGQLKNVATATTEGLEESADATVKIELVSRTMTVEKSASQPTDPKGFLLGQDISYIVTVTNTGNQTLTDIKVNDPMMGPDDLNIGSLVPGATSQAITYTHKVTEMDILNGNGQLKNVATATTEGLEESADATVKIELVSRTMTVEKSASQPTDPKGFLLGQDISYIVTVTNTGNQTLTDIKVNDPMMGPDDLNIGSLVPGATSQAITYTHKVTEMDILNGNGQLKNVATATTEGLEESADATVKIEPVNPSLSILKEVTSATPAGGYGLGSSIEYTVTVTNNGNQTLTGIKVNDPMMGPDDLNIGSLLPGASYQAIVYTHTVTPADVAAGSVINVVTVTAGDEIEERSTTTTPMTNAIDVTGTVEWFYGPAMSPESPKPTEVQVQLYANGLPYGPVQTFTGTTTLWTYTWPGLLKTDANGNLIQYTIVQLGTLTGYTTARTGDLSVLNLLQYFLVRFIDDGGAVLKDSAVSYGGSTTPPADPQLTGSTFVRWTGGVWANVTANQIIRPVYKSIVTPNVITELGIPLAGGAVTNVGDTFD